MHGPVQQIYPTLDSRFNVLIIDEGEGIVMAVEKPASDEIYEYI